MFDRRSRHIVDRISSTRSMEVLVRIPVPYTRKKVIRCGNRNHGEIHPNNPEIMITDASVTRSSNHQILFPIYFSLIEFLYNEFNSSFNENVELPSRTYECFAVKNLTLVVLK